ncbi:MAG: FG-GAP-like repeat-containing protein [Myxococcota bacterium]|nr:FG-GAP-like repeat-containing protein [Myxococcota bacterium]
MRLTLGVYTRCVLCLAASLFSGGCDPAPVKFLEVSAPGLATSDLIPTLSLSVLSTGGATPRRLFLSVASTEQALRGPCEAATTPGFRGVFSTGLDLGADSLDQGADTESASDSSRLPLGEGPRTGAWCVTTSQPAADHLQQISATLPLLEPGQTLFWRLQLSDNVGQSQSWPVDRAAPLTVAAPRPLRINGFAPQRAAAQGGRRILLTGEGFGRGLALSVGGHPATYQLRSNHQLIFELPASAGLARGEIRLRRGAFFVRSEIPFEWIPAPEIDRLDPPEGVADQTQWIFIKGRHFRQRSTISLNGGPDLPLQYLSETSVKAQIPPTPAGPIDFLVKGPEGQTAQGEWRLWGPPRPRAVTPAVGPDNRPTEILIEGEGFRLPGAAWFDGRPCTGLRLNERGTLARCVTPLHPGGLSALLFVNPDEQEGRLERAYRFLGPPRAERAEPATISRCGGGVTRLLGHNFSLEMSVYFNDVPGEILEVDEFGEVAILRAPPGVEGPIRLRIVGPDGRQRSSDQLLVYGVQPVLRALSPREVPVWGGVEVRVEGADLLEGSTLTLNGEVIDDFGILSEGCDGALRFVAPPRSEGPQGPLRLTTPSGVSGEDLEGLLYIAPRLEPAQGLTPGYTNLTLEGVDLREGLTLRFAGELPREAVRESDNRWRLLSPALPRGPVEVEFITPDGRRWQSDELYRVTQLSDEVGEPLELSGDCNAVEHGDFDLDGNDDLVFAKGASNGIGILEQRAELLFFDGAGRSERRFTFPVAGNGMNLSVGDIDADGDLDIIQSNLYSIRNFLFVNDGTGRFEEDQRLLVGESYDAVFTDLDADGDLDIFFAQVGNPENNRRNGPERLFFNDGSGRFRENSGGVDFRIADVHDHDVAIGDLNGDGLPDAVLVVDNLSEGFSGSANRVLLNRGEGRFERVSSPIDGYPGDWLQTELADINGDGTLDIIIPQNFIPGFSRVGTPSIGLYLGDGEGGFEDVSGRSQVLEAMPAVGIRAIDIDKDDDLDLFVAGYGVDFGDGNVDAVPNAILLNRGDGRFGDGTGAFERRRVNVSNDFAALDLDNDGLTDVIECATGGQSRIWRQR